jgi:hypothetical protein
MSSKTPLPISYVINLPSGESAKLVDSAKIGTPKSIIQNPTSEISPHPHHSKLIKIVGVLAVFAVIASVLFLFLQNQSLRNLLGLSSIRFPWVKGTCVFNGKGYQPGEHVPVDSCNTCGCSDDGTIICTQIVCEDEGDQAQTDPTADWQVYSDPENYYSFKYPDYMYLASTYPQVAQTNVNFEDPLIAANNTGFSVRVYKDTKESTLEAWLESYLVKGTHINETLNRDLIMNERVGGEPALKVLPDAYPENLSLTTYLFLHQGDAYEIILTQDITNTDHKAVLDHILSTFEFVDSNSNTIQNEASDTSTETIQYLPRSDWQTYTDSVAKFSVQYPPKHKLGEDEVPGKSANILSCGYPEPNTGEDLCLSGFSISIENEYDQGSRRQWFVNKFDPYQPYYLNWIIDGKNALVVIEGNPNGSSSMSVAIPNGSQMVVVTQSGVSWNPDTGVLPDLTYMKNILSTFQFTN